MDLLGDIYQYPHADFLPTDGTAEKRKREVADAFDALVTAAANLSAVLPQSKSAYALPSFLSERMRSDDEVLLTDLRTLDGLVHRIATLALPPMPKPGRQGPPIKAPKVRILAQVICWYLIRVEREKKIKSVFDENNGEPISKAAKLIEVTSRGMGLHAPHEQIKTQLNAVKNLKFNELGFWDMISVFGSDARL